MTWKTVRLGEVLKRRKEPVKLVAEQEYKLVTIKLYHKGVVLRDVAKGEDIKSAMFSVRAGDFVLSGIDARNGAFGIVPEELDGAIITNDFWCLDPDEALIDKDFLLFLTGTHFFDHICKLSSDGTTQRIRLQKDKFFNFEIQIPDNIDEQKSLVNNLRKQTAATAALTTELDRQLGLVTALRQALLREAVQGLLVPQDPAEGHARDLLAQIKAEKARSGKKEKPLPPVSSEERPFEVPEGWVWCRLGEVIETIFDGPFGSHLKTDDYTNSGVRVVRLENIGSMFFNKNKITYISNEKYKTIDKHTLFEGDVLIGSFLADGVKCTIFPKLEETAIAKADCFTIRNNKKLLNNKFLMYILNSEPLYEVLALLQRGMTRLRVNTSQLRTLPIPLPPLAEQERIVARLEALLAHCDQLEAEIRRGQADTAALAQAGLREALRA